MKGSWRWLPVALCFALLACGRKTGRSSGPETELVVFAASSLVDAFTELGKRFEQKNAGANVRLNFAGTQQLRTQIEHGAPADVLAAADKVYMQALARGGHVGPYSVFARNELVLVVGKEHARWLGSLAELPRAGRIVIGAPEVPVGRYARDLLDRASMTLGEDFRSRVEAKVVSRELNVRQVLARVAMGEADAGIVYRTDAAHAPAGVTVVAIPAEMNVEASYPVAIVVNAPHPKLAHAWVDFLKTEDARRVLREEGFLPPSSGAP
jgi:molybdate transport system substrate-binding protein